MFFGFVTTRLLVVDHRFLDTAHPLDVQPAEGLGVDREHLIEKEGFGVRLIVTAKRLHDKLLMHGHGNANEGMPQRLVK